MASGFDRDKALDVARSKGWTVVDMAAEWLRVFPADPSSGGQ